MRAMCLTGTGRLEAGDIPQPQPGANEVLIRVRAAGITTSELGWYPNLHTKDGALRKNSVPAHEFSGVVEALGPSVTSFQSGDEIFGMNDWFADGALAEYCVAAVHSVILKPSELTHTTAAAIPIAALTAWQGLYTHAGLRSGERVLIHGSAGAVGTFAIQLAKLRGAYVIATASAANRSFVEELGANEVIDYQATPFESVARDIDVVFDVVGGETLARSWATLKPNGRLVTIASDAESSPEARVKQAFFIVEPNTSQLTELANMVVTGKLRVVIDVVVPWSRAADAYSGQFPRQGRGKIVVDCAAI